MCGQVVAEVPESALFTAAEDMERELEARLHRERARVALRALGREHPAKKLRRHFHQAPPPPGQPAAGAAGCSWHEEWVQPCRESSHAWGGQDAFFRLVHGGPRWRACGAA